MVPRPVRKITGQSGQLVLAAPRSSHSPSVSGIARSREHHVGPELGAFFSASVPSPAVSTLWPQQAEHLGERLGGARLVVDGEDAGAAHGVRAPLLRATAGTLRPDGSRSCALGRGTRRRILRASAASACSTSAPRRLPARATVLHAQHHPSSSFRPAAGPDPSPGRALHRPEHRASTRKASGEGSASRPRWPSADVDRQPSPAPGARCGRAPRPRPSDHGARARAPPAARRRERGSAANSPSIASTRATCSRMAWRFFA